MSRGHNLHNMPNGMSLCRRGSVPTRTIDVFHFLYAIRDTHFFQFRFAIGAMETDQEVPPMDPKELERLTHPEKGMFRKWARVENTSAIARFLKEGIDPLRSYSSGRRGRHRE